MDFICQRVLTQLRTTSIGFHQCFKCHLLSVVLYVTPCEHCAWKWSKISNVWKYGMKAERRVLLEKIPAAFGTKSRKNQRRVHSKLARHWSLNADNCFYFLDADFSAQCRETLQRTWQSNRVQKSTNKSKRHLLKNIVGQPQFEKLQKKSILEKVKTDDIPENKIL